MDGAARAASIATPFETAPCEGEAVQVADGIWWMRLPLPMALDHVNVYAIADDDGWTLVDTGIGSARGRAIWQRLLEGPLAGRPVARVLATHHHPDHMGLAGWFQSDHGAALIATRTAWLMARMLVLDEQAVPPPETLAFWRGAGMDPAILQERETARPFNFADVVAPLPLGFRRIADGDVLHLGGRDWDVVTAHGHAPEQATLWCRDEPLVLGGDQLLATISPNIGVYATEPDADPLGEWLSSCERLAGLARDDHLVLPGHKLPFTGLPRRLDQLIENHHGALARLLEHLVSPHVAGVCFEPLFRRQIGAGEYGLALGEAVAHLNHLHRQGAVFRERREDGAWLWRAV